MFLIALGIFSAFSALLLWGGRSNSDTPVSDSEWAEWQEYLEEYDRTRAGLDAAPSPRRPIHPD